MEDLSQQGEPTRSGNPDKKKAKEDQNDNEELGLRVKKPGSKAQGRKRTKTGCLSKSTNATSTLDHYEI